MTVARSDFDLDMKAGAQAEWFVASVRDSLGNGSSTVEVKAPKPFLPTAKFYLEFECRTRTGIWRKSGIQTTKATLWFFTFGSLPGGLVVETEWLRRAARHAWRRGCRQDCDKEPNPTHGVLVGFRDLWETRERQP
jgi:hypothetical protein